MGRRSGHSFHGDHCHRGDPALIDRAPRSTIEMTGPAGQGIFSCSPNNVVSQFDWLPLKRLETGACPTHGPGTVAKQSTRASAKADVLIANKLGMGFIGITA